MPTRVELKQKAKDYMKSQEISPVVVTVVLALISLAVSLLSSILSFTVILPLVFSIIGIFLQVGYTAYCMKVARREQGTYTDLICYIKDWKFGLKLFALTFVVSLFTMLWSLLFVVPGVIKGYSYSQAVMIMIENPQMGIMEAIKESQKMMNGHKMEYFILGLSFILWDLLVAVTCGLAGFYMLPYYKVTMSEYYYTLKNLK